MKELRKRIAGLAVGSISENYIHARRLWILIMAATSLYDHMPSFKQLPAIRIIGTAFSTNISSLSQEL